ncbi:MAG: DoxX family protein [Fimbriimonas sp.]|nr:DoxX family protein [Fimbriimonas sp.]
MTESVIPLRMRGEAMVGKNWTFALLREARWSAVPLRLIVGFGFVAHGVAKLQHGPENFNRLIATMGIPAPQVLGWATILAEIICGAAVLAGALLPAASVLMSTILLVAMFTVHLPYGFSSVKLQAITPYGAKFGPPGYEVDLLYLACMVAILIGGPGPFAFDTLVGRRRAVGDRMNEVNTR